MPAIENAVETVDGVGAALYAHCRRTALWAFEMAQSLGLNSTDCQDVRSAALGHHWPHELLQDRCVSKLLTELGLVRDGRTDGARPSISSDEPGAPRRTSKSVWARSQTLDVLNAANEFDELLEFAPFLPGGLREALENGGDWPALQPMRAALRHCTRKELLAAIPRLPIYPAVAIRALRLATQAEVSLTDLNAVIRQDQVLAGHILAAANSPAVGLRFPVESLTPALNCLGIQEARNVICAAAVRPLFNSPGLDELWRHSIESAAMAQKIAALCHFPLDQAFMAGLLHDIGRLALALGPKRAVNCFERLQRSSCPPVAAELLVFDTHHADAGSAVLRRWGVPNHLCEAVAAHHEPDPPVSDLAALLYLVEFCTGSDEDLPSIARMRAACERLGLRMQDLIAIEKCEDHRLQNMVLV